MSYDRNAGKYDRKPRYQDVLGERVFVQSPEVEEVPDWIKKSMGVHVGKDGLPLSYKGIPIAWDGQDENRKNRDNLWDLYGVTVKEEQGRLVTLLVAGLCNGCGRPQGNPDAEPPKGWDKYLAPSPRHYRYYNEETGGEICGVFTYIAVPISMQDQIENRGVKLLDLWKSKLDILLRKRSEKGHLFRAAQISKDRQAGRLNPEILGLRGLIPTDPADMKLTPYKTLPEWAQWKFRYR